MVKGDLSITIPSFFRCPISLDVMKSPVSLSTGVTYDRSSIQRWLESGNNTCPATMQVLQSKEFVPNHNLQRLIQIWSDSVRQRVPSAGSPANDSLLSREQVVEIVRNMESQKANILDSITKILRFAEEKEENREFLSKIDAFPQKLVDLLDNADGGVAVTVPFLERVVRLLSLVINKIDDLQEWKNSLWKNHRHCLASLLLVLQQGNSDSRICSARVLESIAIDAESNFSIAEKDGLVPELLTRIKTDNDQALIEACLGCLISISKPKQIKGTLVHLGAIQILTELLSKSNPNPTVSITEKVLMLLETLSSCKEGRLEMCKDKACLPEILQKVLKVSGAATEHAVTILWSLCYLFRDQRAQDAVIKANGLTKILLLMQSNCSTAVRQMSNDLLKVFRVNSKSCLSCYDTKTTHIMPF